MGNRLGRLVNLGASTVQLGLGLLAVWQYQVAAPAAGAVRLSVQVPWFSVDLGRLGQFKVDFWLGLDALSAPLLLLSVIVLFLGALASWDITARPRAYHALYLLLSGNIIGCFLALDFFLFFLFFEFMLLPMYFLIGLWGGARREYAAVKFFIYTFLGSVAILVAMIGLYLSVVGPDGAPTFGLPLMADPASFKPGALLSPGSPVVIWGLGARTWAFLLLLVGFAIKLPAVPLHTWLPDAHVEAPTPVSVVLAGVLLKIGAYGLMRIAYPIFPEVARQLAWWVGLAGVVSILYGALVALGQGNLKRMIAYASVSHMGYVLLGLAAGTPEAISGASFQLFSHGLLSALLFLCAGVLYTRTHELGLDAYRGLAQPMPRYATLAGVAFFASLGLPGFSAFVAELLVYLGAFRSPGLPGWMPALALLGLLVGAGYFLWALQRLFLGPFSLKDPAWRPRLTDLTRRELVLLALPAALALLLGIWPGPLLALIEGSAQIVGAR
ncbi:MAG: NADH-quinone oxidoreductase subunit M [Bernardetiaceae bacterium]|nr:NADH-quinone oxidoreductase subunit M [Bernardetiaceae bacterium]